MGSKGAKTAQNGPKCPQMTPDLGQRFPYARTPYHHVFEPQTLKWHSSVAMLLLKMAPGSNSNSNSNSNKQQQRGQN